MDAQKEKFPYLQLVGIVAASAVATFLLFSGWSMFAMHQLRAENERLNDIVRAEIKVLQEHIAVFQAATTSAQE